MGRVKHARGNTEKGLGHRAWFTLLKICRPLLRIHGNMPGVVPALVEIDWPRTKELVLRLAISLDVIFKGALHFIEECLLLKKINGVLKD